MGGAVRIAILAVSAPVAAFFFGIAVHAALVYVEMFNTPWRWTLPGLYRTGGGLVFPGLAWIALFLVLRGRLGARSQAALLGLFGVSTAAFAFLAHRAQTP